MLTASFHLHSGPTPKPPPPPSQQQQPAGYLGGAGEEQLSAAAVSLLSFASSAASQSATMAPSALDSGTSSRGSIKQVTITCIRSLIS